VRDFSLEHYVNDLEAVIDAAGFERFALFGHSQGGAIAVEYAARYPKRVTHLVLLGAYARGSGKRGLPPELMAELEAQLKLVEVGWGREDAAYRAMFSTQFVPGATLEQLYVQSLLLALANPYGFLPSQLRTVLNYLQEHAQLAKLTPVPPVHRMAKAVAIVPVGHDFPPFSANKGGAGEGTKMFLLTFDLAFELQERIRALESGGRAEWLLNFRGGAFLVDHPPALDEALVGIKRRLQA